MTAYVYRCHVIDLITPPPEQGKVLQATSMWLRINRANYATRRALPLRRYDRDARLVLILQSDLCPRAQGGKSNVEKCIEFLCRGYAEEGNSDVRALSVSAGYRANSYASASVKIVHVLRKHFGATPTTVITLTRYYFHDLSSATMEECSKRARERKKEFSLIPFILTRPYV